MENWRRVVSYSRWPRVTILRIFQSPHSAHWRIQFIEKLAPDARRDLRAVAERHRILISHYHPARLPDRRWIASQSYGARMRGSMISSGPESS